MSEAELQDAILDLAKRLGWRTAHFRPALSQTGRWLTAVQGDGKGFPDLVLAKDGIVLFAELKSEKGHVSSEQEAWLRCLTPGRTFIWRPRQWVDGSIERTLRAEARRKAA